MCNKELKMMLISTTSLKCTLIFPPRQQQRLQSSIESLEKHARQQGVTIEEMTTKRDEASVEMEQTRHQLHDGDSQIKMLKKQIRVIQAGQFLLLLLLLIVLIIIYASCICVLRLQRSKLRRSVKSMRLCKADSLLFILL